MAGSNISERQENILASEIESQLSEFDRELIFDMPRVDDTHWPRRRRALSTGLTVTSIALATISSGLGIR